MAKFHLQSVTVTGRQRPKPESDGRITHYPPEKICLVIELIGDGDTDNFSTLEISRQVMELFPVITNDKIKIIPI